MEKTIHKNLLAMRKMLKDILGKHSDCIKIIAEDADYYNDVNEFCGYTILVQNRVYSNYLTFGEAKSQLDALCEGFTLGMEMSHIS